MLKNQKQKEKVKQIDKLQNIPEQIPKQNSSNEQQPRSAHFQAQISEYIGKNIDQPIFQAIIHLNTKRQFPIDSILLRQAYLYYTNLSDLEKAKTNDSKIQNIHTFFNQTLQNLSKIETKYLHCEVEQNQGSRNYQINKNNMSKFIRDEPNCYQNIYDTMAQKVNEEETGINGSKIQGFIKGILDNEHITVIKNGHKYLTSGASEDIQKVLRNYALLIREVEQEFYENANFWVMEDELLQFLSFWLRDELNQDLFVLYTRSDKRMANSVQFLAEIAEMQKVGKVDIVHPSQLLDFKTKIDELKQQSITSIQNSPGCLNPKTGKSILQQYRHCQRNQHQNYNSTAAQPTYCYQPTKREQLDSSLHSLFTFGCKNRYQVHKGTTFDSIKEESEHMDLQKFISFCRYLSITAIVPQQLLIQMFKMYALNLRVVDEARFIKLINRVIQSDIKVIDLLLNKSKVDVKKKRKEVKLNKRNNDQLSTYKFSLRPINGKYTETLEREIQEKRFMKQQQCEKRIRTILHKNAKKYHKSSYKSVLNLSSLIEQKKDDQWDPEKLLIQDEKKDKLWEAYQAKNWRKEEAQDYSILDSVLEKRMEKGRKVLRKFTEQNIKQYY